MSFSILFAVIGAGLSFFLAMTVDSDIIRAMYVGIGVLWLILASLNAVLHEMRKQHRKG